MENSAAIGNPCFHQFHIAKDQCAYGKNMDGATPNSYKNILKALTFFPFILTLLHLPLPFQLNATFYYNSIKIFSNLYVFAEPLI